MPSFFPHDTKTQNHQSNPTETAQKPMIQSIANQQTKPKSCQTTALEILLPAHENTPINSLCRKALQNTKEKEPLQTEGFFK